MERFLSGRPAAGLGTVLMVIGLAKAWLTAQAAGTIMVLGCGGEAFSLSLGQANRFAHLMHCWGCYVALMGLALIMAGMITRTSDAMPRA